MTSSYWLPAVYGPAGVLPLCRRDGVVRAIAIVDDADFEFLSQWRWSLHSDGYACRTERVDGRQRTVLLHRLIAGLEHGDRREVDHENRDRLDCRRSNLRIVTTAGNGQNVTPRGLSRFRGVSRYRKSGTWQASLMIDGRRVHLGYFVDELEAAVAVERRRLEVMPLSFADPALAVALAEAGRVAA